MAGEADLDVEVLYTEWNKGSTLAADLAALCTSTNDADICAASSDIALVANPNSQLTAEQRIVKCLDALSHLKAVMDKPTPPANTVPYQVRTGELLKLWQIISVAP
jgi:hypothetical protein